MTAYQKSALVALGAVSSIFYALPVGIVFLIADKGFGHFLIVVCSFVIPLLACGFALSNWAGQAVLVSRFPSFIMTIASMLCAIFCSTFLTVLLSPSGAGSIGAEDIKVILVTAFVMAAFGTPAAFMAALLFIGGCQKIDI
jgi:hypothetical protein